MWMAPQHRSVSRWAVPGLVLGVGLALAAYLAVDGRADKGLISAGVLAGYALYLVYRRNEPALPLSEGFGVGHRARAHMKAAATTGDVLTIAVVAALVVQALRGADMTPYVWLAALAGATYFLSALAGGRGL